MNFSRITRRQRLAVLAVLLVLLVAGVLAWRWWQRTPAGVLIASGTIEATEVSVGFRISGRVIERAVDEGERVKAGDLVARLDREELEAEVDRLRATLESSRTRVPQLETEIAWRNELFRRDVEKARATLAAREARLAELRAGSRPQDIQKAEAEVAEIRAVLRNAERDFQRLDVLFRAGAATEQSRDAARADLEVAEERLRHALERLALVKEGPRQEEIRRVAAEVQEAEAALRRAQAGELEVALTRQRLATLRADIARDQAALARAAAELGYTVLYSPQAGVVLRKHVEPGETIAAGTAVVTLADLRNIWLKIYVPEPQLGHIKLGQTADITTDSYPGKRYRGAVTFISSEAEFTPKNVQTQEERVKLVFAVKVTVDNPEQELKPGMPADALVYLQREMP